MPLGSDHDHLLPIYVGLGFQLLMTKLPKERMKLFLWLQF